MKDTVFYSISKTEREHITSVISNVLNGDEDIIFAYLYGSFTTESPFEDIDIFIYVRNDKEPFVSAMRIKEKVFDAVTAHGFNTFVIDDFDVKVINNSPYDFAINLLCKGQLIVDKNPELRTNYIEQMSDEYRVNYFILDEAYGEDR